MNAKRHSIETRQRLPEAANYGEWVSVPGGLRDAEAAMYWANDIANSSHSLDVRVRHPNGSTTDVRNEGDDL